MKVFRCFMLFVVSAVWADTNDSVLPEGVSDDVRSAFQTASKAMADGDEQFAHALYEGVLLSGGVTIFIDTSTVDNLSQEQAIHEALDVWYKELGKDFPVKVGNEIETSQVVVKFVSTLADSADSLGKINLTRNYRWNSKRHEVTYSGQISIVLTLEGRPLTKEQTRDVVMHEIGHMLGLADSEVPGTLMGELIREKPAAGPNTNEIADVVALRILTRTKIREMQRS